MNSKTLTFPWGKLSLVIAVFLVVGAKYYQPLTQDFYWTPVEMAQKPSEVSQRIEIYVGGKRLGDTVNGHDVRVRLNNRTEILAEAHLFTIFVLILALVSCLTICWPSYRKNR